MVDAVVVVVAAAADDDDADADAAGMALFSLKQSNINIR